MEDDTTKKIEVLHGAFVEGRHLVDATTERTIRTTSGKVLTHKQLVQELLRRAEIDVTPQPGKRPKKILCLGCKAVVDVPRTGEVPKRCKPCAKRHNAKRRIRNSIRSSARIVADGRCLTCGAPRGDDGTSRRCRPCNDKAREIRREAQRRNVESGLCDACGKPRGDNGTTRKCRVCADKNSALSSARKKSERGARRKATAAS